MGIFLITHDESDNFFTRWGFLFFCQPQMFPLTCHFLRELAVQQRRDANAEFNNQAADAAATPVRSSLPPAVAIAVSLPRDGGRVVRRKIDIFANALQLGIH